MADTLGLSLAVPAPFSNSYQVQTLTDGVVRIVFGLAANGQVEPVAAIVMTAGGAITLRDVLNSVFPGAVITQGEPTPAPKPN